MIGKTVLTVWLSYGDYFPPDFRSEFLMGREEHFFGPYQWAFNVHVVAGPLSLLSGLALLSQRVRRRWPMWHRRVGQAHVLAVLLLVAPSGLWMAGYAETGIIAGTGFATLAVATGVTAAMGWRAALRRRFDLHRRWMHRCYALLCSAVVLRAIGGLSTVLSANWTYPYAAWLCWLLPLAALEAVHLSSQRSRRRQSSTSRGVRRVDSRA